MSSSEISEGKFPRLSTPSYSKIKGTEITIVNLSLGRRETSLYEAPRRDLKAETRTFVSITICIWYCISYHYMSVKHILSACLTAEVSCGQKAFRTGTGFNKKPRSYFPSASLIGWISALSPIYKPYRKII